MTRLTEKITEKITGSLFGSLFARFTGYILPPGFEDDPINPASLLTLWDGETDDGIRIEEKVGKTAPPPYSEYTGKARCFYFDTGTSIAFSKVGETIVSHEGTATLSFDGSTIGFTLAGTANRIEFSDGEIIWCIGGLGSTIIGDQGTPGALTTPNESLFYVEKTDGTGDSPQEIGFNVSDGSGAIEAGALIPPSADNQNLDAIGNPLVYKAPLQQAARIVDVPCVKGDGASDIKLTTTIILEGDFEVSVWYDFALLNDDTTFISGLGANNYIRSQQASIGKYWIKLNEALHELSIGVLSGCHKLTLSRVGTVLALTADNGQTANTTCSTDNFTVDTFMSYLNAHYLTGNFYDVTFKDSTATYTFNLAEASGSKVYTRETDINGDPLAVGDITTASEALFWSGIRPEGSVDPRALYGFWQIDGNTVFYPFPIATSTKGNIWDAVTLKVMETKEMILADLGQGFYTDQVTGYALAFNKVDLDDPVGLQNNNRQYYWCGEENLFTYTDQLTPLQNAEVEYDCWQRYYKSDYTLIIDSETGSCGYDEVTGHLAYDEDA